MKLHGQTFSAPNKELLVLTRNGKDLPIWASAIVSYDEFERLCPIPVAEVAVKPGGVKVAQTDDPDYQKAIHHWAEQRTNWMYIQSLKATPELVWDTVDYNNPSTWGNWIKELEDAFFCDREIQLIMQLCSKANYLNENILEEARKRFLAGQAEE